MTNPVCISEYINAPTGCLRETLSRARRLQQIDNMLANFLGDPLSRHCRLANINANTAVIHTDSPAWATRLRYLLPEILHFLCHSPVNADVTHAWIRVKPAHPKRGAVNRTKRLSRESSALLAGVAVEISDHGLRDALLRLSRHTA